MLQRVRFLRRLRAGTVGASLPAGSLGLQTFASLAGEGNSITAGQGSSGYPGDLSFAWLTLFSSAIGAGTPLNQGIPGTVLQNSDFSGAPKTNNMRDRFVADVMGANKKAFVTIAGGFNDGRFQSQPATFNVTNYGVDLRQMLNAAILGGYAITNICMLSPYWIDDAGLAAPPIGEGATDRPTFFAYVTETAAAALEYGVYYSDQYAYMRDNGGTALIGADNIHPNNAGHAAICQGVRLANRTNTQVGNLPAIATSSTGGGILSVVITPPASGTVTNYTSEYLLSTDTTYQFTGTTTGVSTSFNFTGLANGSYYARTRANFNDGTHSPWVFASAVSVSPFLYDTMTDAAGTAITSHTGETGATWIIQPGLSPANPATIDVNGNAVYSRATTSGTTEDSYQASGTPPSADYYCEATLTKLSTVTNDKAGPAMRMDNLLNTFYFARWNEAGTNWQKFKRVAGTSTQLGGSVSGTFNVSDTHVLRVTATGTSINMIIDGVAATPTTDAIITSAGNAGLYFGTLQTNSTGVHIDKIVASP